MKTIRYFAAAALMAISTMVMAQGQGGRMMRSSSERAKAETERVAKAVELTPEQTAKVLEINLKYAAKDSARFAEMRNGGGNFDRDAMRTAMQEQRNKQTGEIKAVLTDAQKNKYDAYLKELEEQRAARMGGQGGGFGGGPRQN